MNRPPNLNRLAYFAAVVETGSFTAAAARLGVTKAVVSQQVARLEEDTGTALLVRSTRSVRPTEAGRDFHARCAIILQTAEDAFRSLQVNNSEPTGVLRLTAPLDFGIEVVVPAINDFHARYPRCGANLQLSDHKRHLVSDDLDLAIRVGWLADSSLHSHKLADFEQLLVAAPALQDRVASVGDPAGLASLPFIANAALSDPLHWNFSHRSSSRTSVTWAPTVTMDTTIAVREAAILGLGLAVLPALVIVSAKANKINQTEQLV